MEESKRDQPPVSAQSALVASPFSQSSGAGGRDVRALANLALLDLAVSFGPELSGQVNLEAIASLPFPTIVRDLIKEGEPKDVVVTASE